MANQILTNPVFKEAIEIVRKAYIDALLGTASGDDDGRKKYYTAIHCLNDVEAALTGCVQNGRIDKMLEAKKEKANA